MKRQHLIAFILLLAPLGAFAQSDEEILEKVRDNATQIYMEQASFTPPKAFHESGIAPSDRDSLIEKWAYDSATCLANALALYAKAIDAPIAELVNDDLSFSLQEGSADEYIVYRDSCLASAWEAVGARLP